MALFPLYHFMHSAVDCILSKVLPDFISSL